MLEPFKSFFSLRWSNQPYFAPLPHQISRTFIARPDQNPSQKLELLVCRPQNESSTTRSRTRLHEKSSTSTPAILFLHGGFGSATMYADFMVYMSRTYDAPTYALSMRGRGASYALSYLRLVYLTGLNELSSDVNRAIKHIMTTTDRTDCGQATHPRLIVVGHSSGGGLIQYALAKHKLAKNTVSGIVLLDAIPNFGNLSVYANWARHDPWFSLRMSLVHLNHVASPLSSDTLITRAFFGSRFKAEDIHRRTKRKPTQTTEFRALMAPYESLAWPLGMMRGWWAWILGQGGKWLDVKDILTALQWDKDGPATTTTTTTTGGNLPPTDQKTTAEKICIIVGSEDKLMDIPTQEMMVAQYRAGMDELLQTKPQSIPLTTQSFDLQQSQSHTNGVEVSSRSGVRFVIVYGAGHHVQNDIMWEDAIEQIRVFALHV